MSFLLDTPLLVWLLYEPDRLSAAALTIMRSRQNQLHFSSVSIWEIAIKQRQNKPAFTADARIARQRLLLEDYIELSMTSEHALQTLSLPRLHRDPFDRLLLAQAMAEGLTLLTADRTLAKYQGPIRRV